MWAYLCLCNHIHGVLATALGLAEAIGLDVGSTEYGRVDFGLVFVSNYCPPLSCVGIEIILTYNFVLPRTGDNCAFDRQTSCVSSNIALEHGHLAVCGDEGNKKQEQGLGKHFEGL